MADPNHLTLARSGKSAWNAWRRTHPSVCADFSGTDFTAAENRDIAFSGFEFGDSTNFHKTVFGATPIGYQKHGWDPNRGSGNGAALFEGASFGKTRISAVLFSETMHDSTGQCLEWVQVLLTPFLTNTQTFLALSLAP
jgi:hypothetical protein